MLSVAALGALALILPGGEERSAALAETAAAEWLRVGAEDLGLPELARDLTAAGRSAAGDLQAEAGSVVARLRVSDVPPAALPAAARAYRNQFGTSMDDDLAEYREDIEVWLGNWKAAYDNGEPWARGMAVGQQ
jgi:hypothetical protein